VTELEGVLEKSVIQGDPAYLFYAYGDMFTRGVARPGWRDPSTTAAHPTCLARFPAIPRSTLSRPSAFALGMGLHAPEADLRDHHDDLRGRVNAVLTGLSADPRDVSDPVDDSLGCGRRPHQHDQGSGQMRQTTAAEVRLDHGEAACSSATRPSVLPSWLSAGRLGRISLRWNSQGRKIASNEPRIRGMSDNCSRQSRERRLTAYIFIQQ
jgi:hypothetical protein